MAIDRTGINSLDAGAPNLRLMGDIQLAQSIPIELQQRILQYWIQQGDGSSADRIEDVPEEFIKEILPLLLSEAPAQGGMEPMSAAQGGIAGYRGGQLVKPGPGRPGYGGPHETEEAGRSYEQAASEPGGEENWQRQALQQHHQQQQQRSAEQRRAEEQAAVYRDQQAKIAAQKKKDEERGQKHGETHGALNVASFNPTNLLRSMADYSLIGRGAKFIAGQIKKQRDAKEEYESLPEGHPGRMEYEAGQLKNLMRTRDREDPGGEKHGPEIQGPLQYIDPTYSLADAAGTTSDFDLYAALEGREKARFAGDQMITSGNRFIAANGGRIPYAYGGVIGSDGRRAYGLGSFVKKAFKKAKRAVKKIVKSPIGRAALLYAGTAGLGYLGAGAGAAGRGSMFGWLSPGNVGANLGTSWSRFGASKFGRGLLGTPVGDSDDRSGGLLSKFPGGKWGAGILGLSLFGGLTAKGEEDESLDNYIAGRRGTGIDPTAIRSEVLERRGTREKYPFLPADYYAAEGGRIGAANGGIQGLMPRRGRVMYPGGYKGTTWDEFKQDKSRNADVRPGDKSWRDTYYRWLDINTFGEDKAQGGRIGYREGSPHADPKVFASQLQSSDTRPEISSLLNNQNFMQSLISKLKAEGKTPEQIYVEISNLLRGTRSEETSIMDKGIISELKPIAEPFYPDRFEGKEIREPFYPHKFKDLKPELMAQGGRIGYDEGGLSMESIALEFKQEFGYDISLAKPDVIKKFIDDYKEKEGWYKDVPKAQGGRIGYQGGELISNEDEEEALRQKALSSLYTRRLGAQEGGLMDLGGMEKDYRQEGGFVPIGGQEKADDVPARLSKNEFVFTADAVRAAGGGDIDAGAEVMENVMENLEQGGQVSEESQGREGAQNMFATAQRLEGVM